MNSGSVKLLSRDRKGADVIEVRDCSAPWLRGGELRPRRRRSSSLIGRRLKHRHGITLLSDDILNRCRDVLWFPQPSRAAVARPALSIRFIQPHSIQTATCICFEGVHIRSGRISAATTVCTWLLRTWAARRCQP